VVSAACPSSSPGTTTSCAYTSITSASCATTASRFTGCWPRKLKGTDVDPCVLPLVPVTVISSQRCLPLWQEGELLYVATAEPKKYDPIQAVEHHSQCRVRPWVVAKERLDRLIEYHIPYGPGFPRPLPHNLSHPCNVRFQGPHAPKIYFPGQIKGASFGGLLIELAADTGLADSGLKAGRWPAMLDTQVGKETIRGLCGLSVVESWDDDILRLHLDYVSILRDNGIKIYRMLATQADEE